MKNGMRIVAALGMAASALALGGCEKKAGGQVVAVVDGQEITQQQLNAELAGLNVPPNADKKAVQAQVLQQLVNRRLLIGKAKAQGLDRSPTYLAQVQRTQDGILIGMLGSTVAKGQRVPSAAEIDKFYNDNPSQFAQRKVFSVDQIAFNVKPDQALIAKLKAAKTMAEIEAALTAAGISFVRGASTIDSAAVPEQIIAQIAALPPGEPFIVPQRGQLVASVVKSVEAQPLSEDQARPFIINVLRRKSTDEAMSKLLKDARDKAKIEYQPGFAPPAAAKSAPAKS